MPFVWVRTNPYKIGKTQFRQLVENLPTIVAEALSVPGTDGELTPEEIEVKVETFGLFDIHTKDLEIIILAQDFPERKKNLDERQRLITGKVRRLLSPSVTGITGFVWVLLQPGSFGEF